MTRARSTASEPREGGAGRPDDWRVVQGGRAKAYRPIPETERAAALRAALDAYDRGDFFLAHELLEPAWMGTADPVERDLYQGLIKLSAGYVHAVRGNPTGAAKNLRGARDRLADAAARASTAPGAGAHPALADLDLARLLADVELRLAIAESLAAASTARGPRRAGEPARPPVPLEPPAIARLSR